MRNFTYMILLLTLFGCSPEQAPDVVVPSGNIIDIEEVAVEEKYATVPRKYILDDPIIRTIPDDAYFYMGSDKEFDYFTIIRHYHPVVDCFGCVEKVKILSEQSPILKNKRNSLVPLKQSKLWDHREYKLLDEKIEPKYHLKSTKN
ncbi:MAG: hypothetical protein HQL32_15800 [Planctomycetes bacterium]|nr:hypothetical protein [Planctomycetota bacterium]